jgi:hypothetical protein
MARPERRITPRFKLHTHFTFHRKEADQGSPQEANAINISTRGVYFASSLGFCVGEFLEVSVEVPRRLTGTKSISRRFASRVAHVEPGCTPQEQSGIGVQFLYYELNSVSTGAGNAED